jgi:uncharacterized protein DUF3891
MIVRALADGVQLITQPDHAHVAWTFMGRCLPLNARTRRDAILHAIREHDNGWAEEDAAPTVDPATGHVVDFVSAPFAVRQRVWPRGVARLAGDPWAAALVAQHAITVYDRFRSNVDWRSFFAEMEQSRDAMIAGSGVPFDDFLADYAFVRLADLISLTFCADWTDEQRFGAWRVNRSGDRLAVTPDAFGGKEIPIAVTARELPRQTFASDADLRAAIARSPTVTLRGAVA